MAKSKWFTGVRSIDELKDKYKELVKKCHPDIAKLRGENTHEQMKQINLEYEELFNSLPKTAQEQAQNANANDGWREVVNAIIHFDGITVELVGSWIWVSGNTYQHKDALKSAGFFWARKKKMWYWHPAEQVTRSHKPQDMDSIRNKYGSQILANNSNRQYIPLGSPANN